MSEVINTNPSRSELLASQRDSGSNPEYSSSIHLKLPVFEGPLDLLLHLIKENKIDIYDIPIVQITYQYLAYIELMKELNLEIAGEFIVMAATLIHIKSKMLLPQDEEQTEEPSVDPRAELIERLLEYQKFKEATIRLRKREDIWRDVFYRKQPEEDGSDFEQDAALLEVNVFDLLSAFNALLEKAPEQVVEITRETLTVSDKINLIMERLEKEDGIRFHNLFNEDVTRVALIVTFLALLELIRLGIAKAYQEEAFSTVWIINPQRMATTSTDVIHEVLSME